MKYRGEAKYTADNLAHMVGFYAAAKYGTDKVIEIQKPEIFKAMMNELFDDVIQTLAGTDDFTKAVFQTYTELTEREETK